jgi:hypothetical protein
MKRRVRSGGAREENANLIQRNGETGAKTVEFFPLSRYLSDWNQGRTDYVGDN